MKNNNTLYTQISRKKNWTQFQVVIYNRIKSSGLFCNRGYMRFYWGGWVKMTFLEHYLDMFWCHLLHWLISVLHMITIICTMFLDSYKWLVTFDVCICKVHVYINVIKVCVKCHLGFTAAFVLLIATEFVYEVLILIVDLNHQNR